MLYGNILVLFQSVNGKMEIMFPTMKSEPDFKIPECNKVSRI